MATVKKEAMFPATLVNEMFSKVKGHSSLAKMAAAEPIPFNGKDVFVFDFDNEVSIVGESAAKPAGGATIAPVPIRPIKIVYQSRVSDEFVYASEEARLPYLKEFAEGFTKKLASGLDKMAIHGVDPKTGSHSTIIGDNYFDHMVTSNVVNYTTGTDNPDEAIDEALNLVEDANGVIISKAMRSDIAAMTVNGARKYPEFAWGATPDTLGDVTLDSNKTMNPDYALVGDFSAFRWGFAKNLPLEVIEYGDPDGAGRDLKQYNEVLLRSEAYIGWGILAEDFFAKVVAPST